MASLENMMAKRLFSLNMFKDKKIPLGQMSFSKDFVNEKRGDIYPVIEKIGGTAEKVGGGCYSVDGKITRLIGRHIPFCTYEMAFDSLCGSAGFVFCSPQSSVSVVMGQKDGKIFFEFCEKGEKEARFCDIPFEKGVSLVVTARKNMFDVYLKNDLHPQYITTFVATEFSDIVFSKVVEKSTSSVCVSGKVTLSGVWFYIDCGISQADIRPIRYENGEIMIENGRVFLTASLRMQEDCIQGIFSWVAGTSDFELTGALFYDVGDGMWGNDVAASMMFDRNDGVWKLWVCSFTHGHILGYASFDGDVRYGVNLLDITLMDKKEGSCDEDFLAKTDDEDPDFIYDAQNKKWYMAICRIVTDENGSSYRYFFYESSESFFSGYKFIGRTDCGGAETGGSLVFIDKKLTFVCGSSFDKRADYRIYDPKDPCFFHPMTFDYDDGGFRGWGSVIPVKSGNRTRYFLLTFDRAGGSSYTWSYGNVYCFEFFEA